MGHVGNSNLAYAHPGGDLLFDGVSFMVGAGGHAGLVGANGVGTSARWARSRATAAPRRRGAPTTR